MIRVLLVDDSPIALHILQRLLASAPDIQVAGTASNGREALALLPTVRPDVICTDLHMPVMDGLALTKEVMHSSPCPILVVSISVEPGSPNVFRLLEAGAVDIYPKPRDLTAADNDSFARELASKIRIVSGVHIIRRRKHLESSTSPLDVSNSEHTPARLIAIGASTGGPQALREILTHLPANFPLPLVCVQHIGEDFLLSMVTWLSEVSALPVYIATDDEVPQAGKVYFAPANYHLEIDNSGRFILTGDQPYDGHLPSITVTLQSVARHYGASAVGVLLTGMGRDGAAGMKAIASANGITIAQDEASSIVYGMPKVAVNLGVVQHLLPLEEIAPALVEITRGQPICNRYTQT